MRYQVVCIHNTAVYRGGGERVNWMGYQDHPFLDPQDVPYFTFRTYVWDTVLQEVVAEMPYKQR